MRRLHVTFATLLLASGCQTETKVAPTQEETPPAARENSEKIGSAKTQAATAETRSSLVLPGVGSCQPSESVETSVTRFIEYADADGNRKIERKEAESLMNFLMGGFFFRADADGDGTVTAEEGKQARQEFVAQHPALAALMQAARDVKQTTGKGVFAQLAEMMDVSYPKSVSRADVRSAAKGALDDLYRVVDDNKDGTITLPEAQSAMLEGSQAIGHRAFAAADTNSDGDIELNELQAAVESSMKDAFNLADKDSNNKLTEEEAQTALNNLANRLGFPMTAKP